MYNKSVSDGWVDFVSIHSVLQKQSYDLHLNSISINHYSCEGEVFSPSRNVLFIAIKGKPV